ncbi:hypothetical protein KC19_12G071800 [Ceratodon purpureus]|uniref:Amino acid transporter transmembrane domain-containing protein n=1 Tax=Ceratodon purpureus TaxID=3225 RepID=A0A8T0G8H5_CERPU|nr:hypothetical protein KC19_12G071800 [Ceratodon purpureus]
MVEFFSGVGNILGAYGGHGITIEILETMKRPSAYKSVNLAVFFYALLVTSPSSVAVYWSAGDILLKQSKAFAVLPSSGWQTLAIATIIAHQVSTTCHDLPCSNIVELFYIVRDSMVQIQSDLCIVGPSELPVDGIVHYVLQTLAFLQVLALCILLVLVLLIVSK